MEPGITTVKWRADEADLMIIQSEGIDSQAGLNQFLRGVPFLAVAPQ